MLNPDEAIIGFLREKKLVSSNTAEQATCNSMGIMKWFWGHKIISFTLCPATYVGVVKLTGPFFNNKYLNSQEKNLTVNSTCIAKQ